MGKVSIIIAAYNIERYIDRCIDSCVKQTYSNIEIIIVNDGSSDKTLDRIEARALDDRRIKVITQNNSGLIEARKKGYYNASGDYILFLDGDDWIDEKTIETLYNKAIDGKYDVVGYKYILAYDNNINKKNQEYGSYENLEEYDFLKLVLLGKIVPHVVNKFIKKSFIEKNNVEFPKDISFAEDLALSCSIGIHKPKACVLNEYLYYYYQRTDALTKTVSPKLLEVSKSINFIKDELIKNKLLDIYIEEFEYLSFIHNYLYRIDVMYDDTKISYDLRDIWNNMNINIYDNKYYKESSTKIKMKTLLTDKSRITRYVYIKSKFIIKKLLK